MTPTLIDPRAALAEDRAKAGELSAAEVAVKDPLAPPPSRVSLLGGGDDDPYDLPEGIEELRAKCKRSFPALVVHVWRVILGNDPDPIQLDMARWLQDAPPRSITMAFRGFSKSWITGLFALWRLLNDPDEKILVVSGSLTRAAATTNWCLSLILMLPVFEELRPPPPTAKPEPNKPRYRQSGMMFDVGNCIPQQSASFMAMGIGGQIVGFRATCIIPDDVETQTNSLTVTMREKVRDAVKEFDSVLTPGGVIRYLGTPHDADSLYLFLLRLKARDGSPVYKARMWPGLYPTEEERKVYGPSLAPYITDYIAKHGPSVIGHSTMPMRFPDDDLESRRASMGNSEFRLQFMLDLSGSFVGRYPLRLSDLITMDLDDKRGPDELAWGTSNVDADLPVVGFDGDFYYKPAYVGPGRMAYTKVIAYLDPSGKGLDEAALSIVAELFGRLFNLKNWASTDGIGDTTIDTIVALCVRFEVNELHIEDNFGGGTYSALIKPKLIKAWTVANERRRKLGMEEGGTKIVSVTAPKVYKEKRILGIMEPIVQSHRLVVNRAVIHEDIESIQKLGGEETRHSYSLFYQYTHLTKEADCLRHDDRLDSLAGACGVFAVALGVDPGGAAAGDAESRAEEELERIMREAEHVVLRDGELVEPPDGRAVAAKPRRR